MCLSSSRDSKYFTGYRQGSDQYRAFWVVLLRQCGDTKGILLLIDSGPLYCILRLAKTCGSNQQMLKIVCCFKPLMSLSSCSSSTHMLATALPESIQSCNILPGLQPGRTEAALRLLDHTTAVSEACPSVSVISSTLTGQYCNPKVLQS